MGQKIFLRPVGQIDNQILEILRQSLEHTFNRAVEIRPQISSPDYAYDPNRNQYVAPLVLSSLHSFSIDPGDRCLGIVDVDLYAPGLNFVFGEADIGSGVAVISLYRLRQEHYGLPRDEELFRGRAIKEAVHELGHTYYLSHCNDARCVMHFSNSLVDTDVKGSNFCLKCQQLLKGEKRKG